MKIVKQNKTVTMIGKAGERIVDMLSRLGDIQELKEDGLVAFNIYGDKDGLVVELELNKKVENADGYDADVEDGGLGDSKGSAVQGWKLYGSGLSSKEASDGAPGFQEM